MTARARARRGGGGFVAAVLGVAGCGDGATLLEVDITSTTFGLLGFPITFAVSDADGTVVRSGNSTGAPFRVAIQPGAWLSVHEDQSSSPTAQFSSSFTLTDLQPGDHVLHGARGPVVVGLQPVGTMTVRFAGVPALPAGASYYFVGPCRSAYASGSPAVLGFDDTCVPSGAFTIDGYVADTTGPLQHATIAVPGFVTGGAVDVTEIWGPVPARTVTVHGLGTQPGPAIDGLRLHVQAGWGLQADRTVALPAPGDVIVDLPLLAAADDRVTLTVVTSRPGAPGVQRHSFTVDDATLAITLDVGGHPLPWIVGPLVAQDGGVAWAEDGASTATRP